MITIDTSDWVLVGLTVIIITLWIILWRKEKKEKSRGR